MSTTKKSGLGRGLGALLQGIDIASPVKTDSGHTADPVADQPVRHPTDQPNKQPARQPDKQQGKQPASTRTASTQATGPVRKEESAKESSQAKNAATSDKATTTAGTSSQRTSRGLASEKVEEILAAADQNADQNAEVSNVPIDSISRGTYQPRVHFDPESLQELADSITAQGLIQPILLRRRAGGFELIAGERRWRAAQLAGLNTIPAIVREMDDHAVAAVTLIENIQREDLNPLEEASALYRLKNEFDMTDQAVAEAVGRSRTAVSNLIRLLDLDERVAEMLATGKIEMGHARALLTLPADEQHALAMKVYAEGLSVRVAESLARGGAPARKNSRKSGKKPQDSHIKALESQLSEKLGATVSIDHTSSGKGNITVSYNSLDELDGILSHIN